MGLCQFLRLLPGRRRLAPHTHRVLCSFFVAVSPTFSRDVSRDSRHCERHAAPGWWEGNSTRHELRRQFHAGPLSPAACLVLSELGSTRRSSIMNGAIDTRCWPMVAESIGGSSSGGSLARTYSLPLHTSLTVKRSTLRGLLDGSHMGLLHGIRFRKVPLWCVSQFQSQGGHRQCLVLRGKTSRSLRTQEAHKLAQKSTEDPDSTGAKRDGLGIARQLRTLAGTGAVGGVVRTTCRCVTFT